MWAHGQRKKCTIHQLWLIVGSIIVAHQNWLCTVHNAQMMTQKCIQCNWSKNWYQSRKNTKSKFLVDNLELLTPFHCWREHTKLKFFLSQSGHCWLTNFVPSHTHSIFGVQNLPHTYLFEFKVTRNIWNWNCKNQAPDTADGWKTNWKQTDLIWLCWSWYINK